MICITMQEARVARGELKFVYNTYQMHTEMLCPTLILKRIWKKKMSES